MANQTLFQTALAYRIAGRDIIPVHPIKKYPLGIEGWETKIFTDEEIRKYIVEQKWGVGIRNQEGLDFDNHKIGEADEAIKNWKELVEVVSPGLVDRLLLEKTQHGGFHLAWKCDVIGGNQKLAKRLPTEEELQQEPNVREMGFIETRGTGGQFVVSPTPGYSLIKGNWCDLPEVTPEERETLLRCARSLNLIPDSASEDFKSTYNSSDGERPGDKFNLEGSTEALDILKENGWTVVHEREGTIFLRRPGKSEGISATFGYKIAGLFYNFSSNGSPFDVNKAYTPFAVYALLKHNGNFSQAASALAKKYNIPSKQIMGWQAENTDTTNAEKIAELFSKKLRFDHRRNRWLIWRKHNWKPDRDGEIQRSAILTARNQYKEAINVQDLTQRNRLSKWAIQSESKNRLDAAISITKNLPPIADAGDNWDSDLMLLSCSNGIIDLKTGKLRDGKPEDRITMETAVEYQPDATCPRWERFINEIFEDNSELIHYVHKALGYSLTGFTREQVVFFCFGVGSNGKSVLFSIIRDLLKDYAHSAPPVLFQRHSSSTASNDVAAIEFKRFLISSETLSATKINEQRLKKWSGGDEETARYLYSEFFSFQPSCKIWLFINHKPQVEDDSLGFWRRVRLIPFNKIFKGRDADSSLTEKLRNEMPGILSWLVKGCLLWQKEGLEPTPDIVLSATLDYQIENDILAEFLFDKCRERSEFRIKASEFYIAYTKWADEQSLKGKDIITRSEFGRRISDKYQKKHKNDGAYYFGVGLKSEHSDEASDGIDVTSSH